jgi:hypothetical protein
VIATQVSVTESFNREVQEVEEKFLGDPWFILTPEIVFSRTLPAPEASPSPPDVTADDSTIDSVTCKGEETFYFRVFRAMGDNARCLLTNFYFSLMP